MNFEVKNINNKEIPSTEPAQAIIKIYSKQIQTATMEHRSLFGGLELFDGLNTRLTNIETNIASIEGNIMTELNGEIETQQLLKMILVETCMRSKMSTEKLKKVRTC